MAKDPAVLFYTSDFLSGTQYFTDEQCGQYIRLLCQQHQLGHIPDHHMINICKTYDSPVCKKFIKDNDGFWYNERMDLEKEKRINYCKSRKDNRLHKKEKKHMSNHMLSHMDNGNENDNNNTNKKSKKQKHFIPPTLEEWVTYWKAEGYLESVAVRAYKGYSAADPPWTDTNGKPIRSWKQKCQNVWFKPDNEDNEAKRTKKDAEDLERLRKERAQYG